MLAVAVTPSGCWVFLLLWLLRVVGVHYKAWLISFFVSCRLTGTFPLW